MGRLRGIAWYTMLIGLSLIFIAPLVWMLITSFKTAGEATRVPPTIMPEDPTTRAFDTLFTGNSQTPVLLFVVINTVLASSNMFGQAYLITQGAPGNETRTAIMYIAQEGLRDYRMGSAAAMRYLLTLALLLVSVITFRLFRDKD